MTLAIVDCRISEACERALMLRGFRVIKMPSDKRLSAAVASHPDMLMLSHGKRIIANAEYCDTGAYVFTDIREACPNVSITFSDEEIASEYPRDAIYNALIMGDKMFCREATVSRAVIEYANERGIKVINVKQGYPACTVLALSDRAAITADCGMARALSENGIDVTLIENGDIALSPHEYGFIGGAAGVHCGRVYFLGNLDTHRNAETIKAACDAAKIAPVSLSDEKLVDLGRIIFIEDNV